MKNIKIRFIQHPDTFLIQKKTILGWKYIRYYVGASNGDSVSYQYQNKSKELLLDEVLDKHFNACRKYIQITEYPKIKKY